MIRIRLASLSIVFLLLTRWNAGIPRPKEAIS
jgi:hypothetical protein